ncbi:hypothetical protein GLOTRDRAFT_134688 [Gloeophyllum trabeum ATCC 11539]|uniref:Uncharacterized protein n=1 Tax=Gloeophyllum trabeum (strain ATCC 11539 / FP-39264 / Madison 617) TaxID=670483 RepID=S7R5R6_GLOTA|nr:uncharacterized protein GLOTRDRAFT_134688 [Gloeophyllum trabeum ATCC 11539]EPQ49725.1 hypothetical protein GLOTRDRAFT_134688 [Gloeophyllum trabeum ATCC 11539]
MYRGGDGPEDSSPSESRPSTPWYSPSSSTSAHSTTAAPDTTAEFYEERLNALRDAAFTELQNLLTEEQERAERLVPPVPEPPAVFFAMLDSGGSDGSPDAGTTTLAGEDSDLAMRDEAELLVPDLGLGDVLLPPAVFNYDNDGYAAHLALAELRRVLDGGAGGEREYRRPSSYSTPPTESTVVDAASASSPRRGASDHSDVVPETPGCWEREDGSPASVASDAGGAVAPPRSPSLEYPSPPPVTPSRKTIPAYAAAPGSFRNPILVDSEQDSPESDDDYTDRERRLHELRAWVEETIHGYVTDACDEVQVRLREELFGTPA